MTAADTSEVADGTPAADQVTEGIGADTTEARFGAAGTAAGTTAEADLGPVDADEDSADAATFLTDDEVPSAVEAVLLVVDTPVTEAALAAAVGRPAARVREHLIAMAQRLTAAGSGMDLREAGGGWRLYTRNRFAPIVERFVLDGAQTRLSRAALESLAVIAYRQPVTRARIAAVRGVNVDGVIRTLLARGLIEESGADPDTGGTTFRTTALFLERMGLTGIDELPSLGPLLPDVDDLDV